MASLNRRGFRSIVTIVIVLIVLFVLNVLGFFQLLRLVIIPIEQTSRQALTGEPKEVLDAHVAQLKQLSELTSVEYENRQLRELLEFKQTIQENLLVANVISYDPNSATVIFIDLGTNDGIYTGLPVVSSTGVLAGKIVKSASSTSEVELITGASSRLAATALENDSIKGLIRGYLATTMKMEYVLDKEHISNGSTIITSGLEPLIPRGLLIGTVSGVEESSDQLFVNAVVDPLTRLDALRIVSVLKPL